MSLFSRRRTTGTSPIGAVVEGDAATFAWRAELRARLDDQISRATTVTLAAAKSWARLEDPPPGDAYVAEALHNGGLWGSTVEPGTHIARWSEDDRTVTLRAWDWDLTRPLSSGGYEPMVRVRTLPWPKESGEAHGSVPEDDLVLRGSKGTRAQQPVERPRSPRDGSGDVLGELGAHDEVLRSESPAIFARLQDNQGLVALAELLIVLAVGTLLIFALEESSLSPSVNLLLRIAVFGSAGVWLTRRGQAVGRVWKRSSAKPGPKVGDGLTRHQKALHILWRAVVVVAVCGFPTMMIAYLVGIRQGFVALGLFVVFLVTTLWYRRFANRPVDP